MYKVISDIILESVNNLYEIKGKSIQKNTRLFYSELIYWFSHGNDSIDNGINLGCLCLNLKKWN